LQHLSRPFKCSDLPKSALNLPQTLLLTEKLSPWGNDCDQSSHPSDKSTKLVTKTSLAFHCSSRPTITSLLLGAVIAGGTFSPRADAQIYVANAGNGTIGEYDATTGAAINAGLVSGLSTPIGLALSGSDLFVANLGTGTIGEYNAITGAAVASSLVTGLPGPVGVAVAGGDLYVTDSGNGTIGEYNASTGAAINSSLVSGLAGPQGVVVFGSNLLVSNFTGVIGEYDASTGTAINASFITTGLSNPDGLFVSGGHLFVSNNGNGTAGEYNATTGAAINTALVSGLSNTAGVGVSSSNVFVTNGNAIDVVAADTGGTLTASFITGLNGPEYIAVQSVPEPAAVAALAGMGVLGVALIRRRRPAR